jgi:hypothetical protein
LGCAGSLAASVALPWQASHEKVSVAMREFGRQGDSVSLVLSTPWRTSYLLSANVISRNNRTKNKGPESSCPLSQISRPTRKFRELKSGLDRDKFFNFFSKTNKEFAKE